MDWSCKFAAWSHVDAEAAHRRLLRLLAAHQMTPLGPVSLSHTDQHAFIDAGQRPVFMAEVRALRLATPNPMPRIRLWGR
jgi:hypothetical protein